MSSQAHAGYFTWVGEEYRTFFRRVAALTDFNGISGDYCEFGCHGGLTFRAMFEALNSTIFGSVESKKRHMWGFDSFQGLPSSGDERDIHRMWRPGALNTSRDQFVELCRRAGITEDRYSLVEGFYETSLFDPNDRRLDALKDVAIAYIDCDMYTSTRDVLRFLTPKLKHGMIFCLDDYYCNSPRATSGEKLAFEEFTDTHSKRFKFVEYFKFHWAGTSFIAEARQESP